jgi:toxin HigB-1
MIKTFKSKELEQLFKEGIARGISKNMEKRTKARLESIDSAVTVDNLRIPGYDLHELKGDRKGTWSIKVNKNWRITFGFEDGYAYDVNFEDYH